MTLYFSANNRVKGTWQYEMDFLDFFLKDDIYIHLHFLIFVQPSNTSIFFLFLHGKSGQWHWKIRTTTLKKGQRQCLFCWRSYWLNPFIWYLFCTSLSLSKFSVQHVLQMPVKAVCLIQDGLPYDSTRLVVTICLTASWQCSATLGPPHVTAKGIKNECGQTKSLLH